MPIADTERHARLQLSHSDGGQVLTAFVPGGFTADEFASLAKPVVSIIHRLTGCNCGSGRVKVVIQDDFNEVIRVNF